MRVAVATSSQLAADAAAEIAELGGNAVDCGIAAALVTMNTQPGVCALAGGAYLTIWSNGASPVTIDGNVAVPGRGTGRPVTGTGVPLHLGYGGGVDTLVGAASVAVPGSLAALETASREFGIVRWEQLLAPVIRATREGFPLPSACHHYLCYSGTPIFGRSPDGFAALHFEDGTLRARASNIRVPHLADSLAAIAREGSRIFYEGEIAGRMAQHVQQGGGALTLGDLRNYRAIVRKSLSVDLNGWHIATNPPPAIGGATLGAMLVAFGNREMQSWDPESLKYLARVQRAVLSFRRNRLDLAEDVALETARLLELVRAGQVAGLSASTVHTSAVDDDGLACSITASSGYGSGEMPQGTGLWLNNCLGELELNRRAPGTLSAGERLPSNMAPTVARSSGSVLSIGTPGADRITTALHQFLVSFLLLGLGLDEAILHPRMHAEIRNDGTHLAVEPGLSFTPEEGFSVTRFPERAMYFGGVAAALFNGDGGFAVAADPRREGATFVSP